MRQKQGQEKYHFAWPFVSYGRDRRMRCFFAIEFDDETRNLLAGIQDALRSSGVRGNYTRMSNLHLTLKFLGEITPDMLTGLEQVSKKVASRHEPFVLELGELGKFSKGKRPIVWCGLKASRQLMELQRDLATELASEFRQFSDNEKYIPHITLVREVAVEGSSLNGSGSDFSETAGDMLGEILNKAQRPDHKITVSGISLMESVRVDGKLVYIRKLYAALRK